MPTVCLMCPTTVVLQINHWAFYVPYIELKVCTCTLKAEFARLLNLMRDQCIKLASHESESTCLRKISRQQPPSCQICSFFRLSANAHKYQRMISNKHQLSEGECLSVCLRNGSFPIKYTIYRLGTNDRFVRVPAYWYLQKQPSSGLFVASSTFFIVAM